MIALGVIVQLCEVPVKGEDTGRPVVPLHVRQAVVVGLTVVIIGQLHFQVRRTGQLNVHELEIADCIGRRSPDLAVIGVDQGHVRTRDRLAPFIYDRAYGYYFINGSGGRHYGQSYGEKGNCPHKNVRLHLITYYYKDGEDIKRLCHNPLI